MCDPGSSPPPDLPCCSRPHPTPPRPAPPRPAPAGAKPQEIELGQVERRELGRLQNYIAASKLKVGRAGVCACLLLALVVGRGTVRAAGQGTGVHQPRGDCRRPAHCTCSVVAAARWRLPEPAFGACFVTCPCAAAASAQPSGALLQAPWRPPSPVLLPPAAVVHLPCLLATCCPCTRPRCTTRRRRPASGAPATRPPRWPHSRQRPCKMMMTTTRMRTTTKTMTPRHRISARPQPNGAVFNVLQPGWVCLPGLAARDSTAPGLLLTVCPPCPNVPPASLTGAKARTRGPPTHVTPALPRGVLPQAFCRIEEAGSAGRGRGRAVCSGRRR